MFEYRSYPSRVIFGVGSYREFVNGLSEDKTILVIASNRVNKALSMLKKRVGERNLIHFSKTEQHVPQSLVDEAVELLSIKPVETIVAIGGGSAIGLAKALALEFRHPIIAVPTTYSGSEQTNIWGISSDSGKTTGKSDLVLPKLVVYDPEFTKNLPLNLAFKSGMNAMAHLVEAVYAPDGNPVTRHNALFGMKLITKGLTELAAKKEMTQQANEELLLGAWLAGKSLCEVSMSLHHKTAHVLGGSFGMDHASVHTVLQPYVLEYQWNYLSDEIKQDFITSLGTYPAYELKKLAKRGGVETDLKSIGFDREDLSKAVEIILSRSYANIAPLEEKALFEMLENAYNGTLKHKPE